MKRDDLGDRMKHYENMFAPQLMPKLPAIARIDGRCFSKFTRGLERPYDIRLSKLMVDTTKYLVDQCDACIGYTQSDEISLCWLSTKFNSQIIFDGKINKMVSILAAMASVYFSRHLLEAIPEKADELPVFDCRIWNVPSLSEAANAILWREMDATRNSVSMLARAHFSHKQLHGKSREEMMDMLMEKGVNWNDCPVFFKRGTFVRRKSVAKLFEPEEIESLPERHPAKSDPNFIVMRHKIAELDMPPFSKVTNRAEVIFEKADPEIE